MAYGSVVTVPAPVEAYSALHAEIEKATDGELPDGLMVHIARPVDGGFEVREVWESKALADTYNAEVVWPAMAKMGQDTSGPAPVPVEFEPAGLMLSRR